MITADLFKVACPTNKEPSEWVEALNAILPKYSINTTNRIAMFLAQTGHESSDYKLLIENLNYSAQGLLKTFPKYYTPSLANAHARKPQLIANHVYAGRMGNDRVNDGWTFRGRGLIQLTGRSNHADFGKSIGMTAEQSAAYCETKRGAVESACWFWTANGLNGLADKSDYSSITRRINGGLNGQADRNARLARLSK